MDNIFHITNSGVVVIASPSASGLVTLMPDGFISTVHTLTIKRINAFTTVQDQTTFLNLIEGLDYECIYQIYPNSLGQITHGQIGYGLRYINNFGVSFKNNSDHKFEDMVLNLTNDSKIKIYCTVYLKAVPVNPVKAISTFTLIGLYS